MNAQIHNQELLVVAIQKQMDNAVSLLAKMKKQCSPVEKWEPKGGDYWVSECGEISKSETDNRSRLFGSERDTKSSADKALKVMRQSNRLHTWISENVTGEVSYKVEFEEDNVAIVIYAPKDDISRLEQLVNNGTVVL